MKYPRYRYDLIYVFVRVENIDFIMIAVVLLLDD